MAGNDIERWLDAADRMKRLSVRASDRAARAVDQRLATRLEREADIHLQAAVSFERTARANFQMNEIELRLARTEVRRLQAL